MWCPATRSYEAIRADPLENLLYQSALTGNIRRGIDFHAGPSVGEDIVLHDALFSARAYTTHDYGVPCVGNSSTTLSRRSSDLQL